MSRIRLLILLLGPVPIVACSMALTHWARSEPAPPVSGNHAVVRAQSPDDLPSVKKFTRPPAPIPAEPDLRPRDNAEIDRVMDAVERLWHRLVELMTSIQRDPQKKS